MSELEGLNLNVSPSLSRGDWKVGVLEATLKHKDMTALAFNTGVMYDGETDAIGKPAPGLDADWCCTIRFDGLPNKPSRTSNCLFPSIVGAVLWAEACMGL